MSRADWIGNALWMSVNDGFIDSMPEPHRIKRRVYSIALEEFCVRALLHDAARLQYNNCIGAFNGREAVSNQDCCTSTKKAPQALPHQKFLKAVRIGHD